jgi:hypothetical protein
MSTKTFIMPKSDGRIGQSDGKPVKLDQRWREYLGGLEDVSGRVASELDGTATMAELVAALKAAGLMKG